MIPFPARRDAESAWTPLARTRPAEGNDSKRLGRHPDLGCGFLSQFDVHSAPDCSCRSLQAP